MAINSNVDDYCRRNSRHFYEGRFTRTKLINKSLKYRMLSISGLSFVREAYLERFLSRYARKGGLIADLGCGGGYEIIARSGEVVGIDLSVSSLENARCLYHHVIVADLATLPFRDNSFLVCMTVDVLGHIEPCNKDKVLSEIRRVTDFITINVVELDPDDPLTNRAKRHYDVYHKGYVQFEEHIGLESIKVVEKRFRKEFASVRILLFNIMVMPISAICVRFAELKAVDPLFRLLHVIAKTLSRSLILKGISDIILNILNQILSKVVPPTWASGALIIGCGKAKQLVHESCDKSWRR